MVPTDPPPSLCMGPCTRKLGFWTQTLTDKRRKRKTVSRSESEKNLSSLYFVNVKFDELLWRSGKDKIDEIAKFSKENGLREPSPPLETRQICPISARIQVALLRPSEHILVPKITYQRKIGIIKSCIKMYLLLFNFFTHHYINIYF